MFGKVLLVWLLFFSVYAFAKMGWDKRKAVQNERRVPEKHFFKLAALGGSLGILLGMKIWRHKTHKWSFKRPVFLIVFLQISLLLIGLYFW